MSGKIQHVFGPEQVLLWGSMREVLGLHTKKPRN